MSPVFKLVVALALAMPWLMPPQGGPSPAILPWFFSLICMGLLVVLWFISRPWASALSRFELGQSLAGAWLAAALLSCLIGLCQYLGVAPSFFFMSPAGGGEAFANLRQRNQFASLINIGLCAVLWWAAQAQPTLKNRAWTGSLMLATVLLALGNAASSSRTGLFQLGLIAMMTWWWCCLSPLMSTPLFRRLLIITVVSYLLAALLLPVLVGHALGGGIFARLQEGGPACSSRLVLWSNVLHLIAQKPWLGWGWDELRYAHFITLYEGPRFCEIMGNAHNLPLHLAVTLGLPAALLLCGSGVWLVWRARPWRETDATRQLPWGVLAVIGLHSLLEYPLWYGPFQMAVGLCGLLLWQTRAQVAGKAGSSFNPSTGAIQAKLWGIGVYWFVLVLLAGLIYAAWDYHRISQIYLPVSQRAPAYRENTLAKIKSSWLFQNQVRFAELSVTPLTPDNAERLNALAHEVLHYSPEARVVEKSMNSARLLGREDEAQFFDLRFRAAYPEAYARAYGAGFPPTQE